VNRGSVQAETANPPSRAAGMPCSSSLARICSSASNSGIRSGPATYQHPLRRRRAPRDAYGAKRQDDARFLARLPLGPDGEVGRASSRRRSREAQMPYEGVWKLAALRVRKDRLGDSRSLRTQYTAIAATTARVCPSVSFRARVGAKALRRLPNRSARCRVCRPLRLLRRCRRWRPRRPRSRRSRRGSARRRFAAGTYRQPWQRA
jgi:hypothetical protein